MNIYDFLILAALLSAVIIITLMLCGAMKKRGFKVNKAICIALMLAQATAMYFLFGGLTLKTVKGVILSLILLYAAVQDYSIRECDDALWVMILILSLVGFDSRNIISMLLGGAAIFVPQMIVVIASRRGSIGGADIKISTAAGILLGFHRGVIGYAAGLTVAVIIMTIYGKVKKKDKSEPFPLMPFLSAGFMLGYFI